MFTYKYATFLRSFGISYTVLWLKGRMNKLLLVHLDPDIQPPDIKT